MSGNTPLPQDRQQRLALFLQTLNLSAETVDPQLLDMALTHRSWATENKGAADNERLELLGDAVIGLVATEYLYRERPEADEGDMSKTRATVVSRRVLGMVARDMGLGELLRLGVGETAMGGAHKLSTIGSALEAVVGALYLSLSYRELVPRLTEHVVLPALSYSEREHLDDHKSALQEWAQGQGTSVPSYRVLDERGPDHDREFVVEVSLNGKALATGRGKRKQWAEKAAAEAAMENVRQSGAE